ncbi:MAG: hypothetical protein ACE5G5_12675 [Candidatus Methylomirabilales bacterium]
MGVIQGPGAPAPTVLKLAMAAAVRKETRVGLRAVAKAFTAIGDSTFPSLALSRLQQGWPEDEAKSLDQTTMACWNSS